MDKNSPKIPETCLPLLHMFSLNCLIEAQCDAKCLLFISAWKSYVWHTKLGTAGQRGVDAALAPLLVKVTGSWLHFDISEPLRYSDWDVEAVGRGTFDLNR